MAIIRHYFAAALTSAAGPAHELQSKEFTPTVIWVLLEGTQKFKRVLPAQRMPIGRRAVKQSQNLTNTSCVLMAQYYEVPPPLQYHTSSSLNLDGTLSEKTYKACFLSQEPVANSDLNLKLAVS